MIGRHALRRRLALIAAFTALAGFPWALANLGLIGLDAVLELHALAVAAGAVLASVLLCRAVWRRSMRRIRDDLDRAEAENRVKDLSPRTFAALCLAVAAPILCGFAVVKVWEVAQVCAREFTNLVQFGRSIP